MTSICRHIRTNGERCGSPSLRNHVYCYYHRSLRRRHPSAPPEDHVETIIHTLNPHKEATEIVAPIPPRLDLPALEDRESIQVALSVTIGALARNDLDPKRAATLLYGLQVASANAAKLHHIPSRSYLVTETTTDAAGQELAPDEDPKAELDYQQFLLNMAQESDEDDDADADEEAEEDEEEEF